jgi:CRP-like cAMP-binding protein
MNPRRLREFDAEARFTANAVPRTMVAYKTGEPIYFQGGPCDTVLFIRSGEVRLSVVSELGKEAVVAILG